MANDAAGCPWRSSCKSPRTLQKCKLLITRQLTFGAVLGEHYLTSPSTRLKVNHLYIRCLCFESVRGDLQEGHIYGNGLPFSLPDATCPSSRAQKCRFCARNARKQGFRTPKAHKNANFVLEMLENGGLGGKKSTKTSILCSKCPKTGVPDPKSAQKPRFCARNARKRGFQTPKAHKNLDFVLEKPENKGSRPQKSTKTSILCSKCLKTRVSKPQKAQKCRFCARERWQEGLGVAAGQRKEHREAEK